jgi:MFS family permease
LCRANDNLDSRTHDFVSDEVLSSTGSVRPGSREFVSNSSRRAGLRNRWWVVGASMIGIAVGPGTINTFCFAIFLKPVSDDLGVGRNILSSGLLCTNALAAIGTLLAGLLIDRFGNRRVMLPGIAMFAISIAALSTLQASSISLAYVLFGFAGLFGAVQTPAVYAAVICKWFDRERGLALGLAMAGVGLGVLVVPQLAGLTIGAYGWRTAYLALSAMIIVCAFVPIAVFVREPNESSGERCDDRGSGASLAGLTIMQALTQWRFWSLCAAGFIGGMSMHGTLTQAVAMLTDRGFGSQIAAATFSSAGLAMIVGRVACGYLLDKFNGPRIAIGAFIAPMAGIALLASGAPQPVPLIGILLCGFGVGAQIGLQPYFASRYFGLKSVGAISGATFGSYLVGTGVGSYLSTLCFDMWHSYVPAFIAYVIALGFGSMLLVPLGRYPFGSSPTPSAG